MNLLDRLLGSRFWALATKEINQILRSKQLLFLLIFPPTVQILLYGAALNPELTGLPLGVVDYANVAASRELVSGLTNNRVFVLAQQSLSEQELADQVARGNLTAGLVIPPDFPRSLANQQPTPIQVLVDGVDANQAGIAIGYLNRLVNDYNRRLQAVQSLLVTPQVRFLYNPGLVSSWFFAPGAMGLVLTLTGSLVSAVAVVREKSTGTLEQLLMTPAEAWEILLAKIAPLFLLLMADVLLALLVNLVLFQVPFRGNFFLFVVLSGLYMFVGIGFGLMLATISKSPLQTVLTSFFINFPLIQLSGALSPIESMPVWVQYLSWLDPLRHYVTIIRGILLKGIGLDVLLPNVLTLAAFVAILMTVSTRLFRRQLR